MQWYLHNNAPINVNPEGGGGAGKGGGFDQSGDPVGRDLDWHFFSKWPEGGDFWQINTDLRRYILKKPEPIFEQTEDWALVHPQAAQSYPVLLIYYVISLYK
jgi:hypothetical protein